MDKENDYTKVTEADLVFLKKELLHTEKAFITEELTEKLAFKKTSGQLQQEVKIYDQFCKYEVGDLIYKEYDEPLMVSSKGVEHFKGSVVLKVVSKIPYEHFNCEMLEVGYTGSGTFRKHIDYMKKTKTQVLLPSNYENKGLTPEVLKKEEDPRRDQVPMTGKDLKKLEKNLRKALTKSDDYFHWNVFWQLKQKQIKIPQKKIEDIKKHIRKTQQSIETKQLCSQFFKQDPKGDAFELFCLSLNHVLENEHKKTFVFVSPKDWGKWHLKEVLDSFTKNLPLTAPSAKIPSLEGETKGPSQKPQKFPLKIYLTWREIHSGGIQIPKSLKKHLAEFREYIFTDTEEEKDYTVYYYPSSGIFLGLKDFYENNHVPQGASLSLENKAPGHFRFWLKKSKKKLSVPKVAYDPKTDKFSDTGEEVFTFSLPNKIIHLERDTLSKLFALYNQRKKLNLRELLILVFNHFGLEGETLLLHYLRAFHLIDVLKRTTQEDVQKMLLSAPEFTKSEKKKGIFFYTEKVKTEEEISLEEPEEIPSEAPKAEEAADFTDEAHLAIGTIAEEVPPPEIEEEIEVKEEEPAEQVPKKEEVKIPEPAEPLKEAVEKKVKKAAAPKKKKKAKVKIEGEAAPRRRKGEKKFIEERIEMEEFEHEALIAVKAEEEKEEIAEKAAAPKKKKKEEYKPYVSGEPTFGVFAEKLKSALDQKTQESDEDEKPATPKKAKKDKKAKKK
jgi:hypothetical protein